jgi:hypothetical protein
MAGLLGVGVTAFGGVALLFCVSLNAIACRNRSVEVSLNLPTAVRNAFGALPATEVINLTDALANAEFTEVPGPGDDTSIASIASGRNTVTQLSRNACNAIKRAPTESSRTSDSRVIPIVTKFTNAAQNFSPSAAARASCAVASLAPHFSRRARVAVAAHAPIVRSKHAMPFWYATVFPDWLAVTHAFRSSTNAAASAAALGSALKKEFVALTATDPD